MRDKKALSQKVLSRIAKGVMKNSLNISSYVCLALLDLGEITMKSFLNPYACIGRSRKDWQDFHFAVKPNSNNLSSSIGRLIEQGIVEKKGSIVRFTAQGKRAIESIIEKKKMIEKKWDGKYRLVIFDIPENKRYVRDWLREELYLLKYVQLQKSVFIGRHPLTRDIVADIKRFGVYENVNYLLVDKIFDERKLRKHHT